MMIENLMKFVTWKFLPKNMLQKLNYKRYFFFFLLLVLFCFNLCVEAKGQLSGVNSVHNMGPKDGIEVTRLGTKCIYLLSHLTSLGIFFPSISWALWVNVLLPLGLGMKQELMDFDFFFLILPREGEKSGSCLLHPYFCLVGFQARGGDTYYNCSEVPPEAQVVQVWVPCCGKKA